MLTALLISLMLSLLLRTLLIFNENRGYTHKISLSSISKIHNKNLYNIVCDANSDDIVT